MWIPCLCCALIIIALAISIIAIYKINYIEEELGMDILGNKDDIKKLEQKIKNFTTEKFANLKFPKAKALVHSTRFPKAGDAQKTGWYRTLGRECEPGLNKCVVKNNSGSYHYFCSENPNCSIPGENVSGKKVEEPMDWAVRFA